MELALRVLIAAALLSSVHARAAAVQENNPPSQAQAAAARDINALVRQVLTDRIPAKDIPGLGGDAKRIAVRSDRVRLPLGQDALPELEGYELRLVSQNRSRIGGLGGRPIPSSTVDVIQSVGLTPLV